MRQSARYNAAQTDNELVQRPRTAESYRNPNNDMTPGSYNNYGRNRGAYNNSWMNSRERYNSSHAWRNREYENTYDMGSTRNNTTRDPRREQRYHRNKSTAPSEDSKGFNMQGEHGKYTTKQNRPLAQKHGQNSRLHGSKSTGPSEALKDYNEKERKTEQNIPCEQKDGQNLTSCENKSADSVEDLGIKRDYQMLFYRQAVLVRESDDDGWPHVVGSCPDMCPAEEREKRARLRDLAVFERVNDDQSKTSKELAVKKFCRTFSGKNLKQSDVRPLPVLHRTMQHLLKILDMESYSFQVVHDFLFDRTRAVRQEFSMQRIVDKVAVSIYETIVRFHIMSERELRRQRACGKVFDSHLNFQQLSKALLSLLNLYLMHDDGFQSEAEFYCYYVLLNLNQPQQLSLWFQSVKPGLLKSKEVQLARNVLKYYQQKNYRGFFRLVTKATYLQACLMELYFNEVRAAAINMINYGAYKLHPFPLSELADMLLMEVEDMEEFCILHGLAVGLSPSNELQLLVKQASFTPPTQDGLKHYHCQVIQNKRPAKFKELCTNL